jgi:Fe-S oxidoreductase
LAGQNLAAFERAGISSGSKRLVSHCPHCVNSFLQDYSQLGATIRVTHHTEFLAELVRDGRLKLPPNKSTGSTITYHDPCYLARAAGVTVAPRELLSLSGRPLVEMPRCGRQTACCGAGGGRMWFDDTRATRVGQSRVNEAVQTGAATLAVSCPFCLTMTSDGMAERDHPMTVRDIAEILADSLPPESSSTNNLSSKPNAL